MKLPFFSPILLAPLIALAPGTAAVASENVAAQNLLPEGPGLAQAYPGDTGLGDHPSVRFADNFETGELGARWDEARNPGGNVLGTADPGEPALGQRCLTVTATLGKDTGGGFTKWFDPAPAIFIRFYTRFAADVDYIHHFVTLRANRGLTGRDRWSGFGGAGQQPDGEGRFTTALEPSGNSGRWQAPGRWNFYTYWHEMAASPDGKYWGTSFRPESQPDIPKESWICCEFMLVENSPGQPDGEQAFWIDGQLRGHWKGINWRISPTLRANALTLETFVTDRWTKNRVNTVWFDNVAIASEYIGPSPQG
ncbi:hypothetical protein BH23VER1_BH23VER1_35600 [soil metagenome]